jgi:heparin binding hemagglutinin HbhA
MTFSAPEPGDTPAGMNGTVKDGMADEHRPTPLLAMLGAGDAAVAAVARAFADAYAAAASRRETVQHRVHELPAEFESLRSRFSGDELRHALETYRAQIERAYAQFAGRGEEAWDKLREKPQVRHAMTTFESRVDNAQEAASRALATASRQSRVAGEKVARAGQRFTGRAADAVVDVSAATADAVEDAGTVAAEVIEDAGDEAAAATRKATASTEPTAAPAAGTTVGKPAPKRAVRPPAAD